MSSTPWPQSHWPTFQVKSMDDAPSWDVAPFIEHACRALKPAPQISLESCLEEIGREDSRDPSSCTRPACSSLTMVKGVPTTKAKTKASRDACHYRHHRKPRRCARCFWSKHGGRLKTQLTLKESLPSDLIPHAQYNLDDTWVVVAQDPQETEKKKYIFKKYN